MTPLGVEKRGYVTNMGVLHRFTSRTWTSALSAISSNMCVKKEAAFFSSFSAQGQVVSQIEIHRSFQDVRRFREF
jgi:hydroxymethylglutaryl-CoA reductase